MGISLERPKILERIAFWRVRENVAIRCDEWNREVQAITSGTLTSPRHGGLSARGVLADPSLSQRERELSKLVCQGTNGPRGRCDFSGEVAQIARKILAYGPVSLGDQKGVAYYAGRRKVNHRERGAGRGATEALTNLILLGGQEFVNSLFERLKPRGLRLAFSNRGRRAEQSSRRSCAKYAPVRIVNPITSVINKFTINTTQSPKTRRILSNEFASRSDHVRIATRQNQSVLAWKKTATKLAKFTLVIESAC